MASRFQLLQLVRIYSVSILKNWTTGGTLGEKPCNIFLSSNDANFLHPNSPPPTAPPASVVVGGVGKKLRYLGVAGKFKHP